MRIVIIGATGTIGKEVVKVLARKHQLVRVGRQSGDFQVDSTSKASLEQLFPKLDPFDAVICTAGEARAGRLADLTDEDFMVSLTNKLMGQVNVVRVGCDYINKNGSFTLTSGVLSREPLPGMAAISMVNAAVEGFVRAAAQDLERGLRINAVSPLWATESLAAPGLDARPKMPAAQFMPAYQESVEGHRTGEVLDVRDFVYALSESV